MSQTLWPPSSVDPTIANVRGQLLAQGEDMLRSVAVFCGAFDQSYDVQHPARYEIDQLFKAEKAHSVALIQTTSQCELKLDDGPTLTPTSRDTKPTLE